MVRRMAVAMAVAGAVALGLPGTASGGGFATVGLSSVPDGTQPGATWRVTLTVLQHGIRPLSGVEPVVRIRSADGRTTHAFAAAPAGRPGVYRADVVFPSAGRWSYEVDDGFTQTHRFAPVRIGAARASAPATAPTRSDGGDIAAALAAAVAAGLAGALVAGLTMRRRGRPVPAAAPR